MINRLQLLRNIGQFDSVNGAANIPLARVTVIYAENGRGKTTLSAIFRSLATGDPTPIAERRRLAAHHPPHVVLDCDGGPPALMFQGNAWNRTLPNIALFDDVFVDQNICSGLAVGSDQRQKLHQLILGAQGVALNQRLQQLIAQIETHNASLRAKGTAIPAIERGALSIDEFCALPDRANIDEEILAAERNLAAAREQDPIRGTPAFDPLSLPIFDPAAIQRVLQQDLPVLDAAAVERVQAHLAGSAQGAEAWVADGIRRLLQPGTRDLARACPFCAQDLLRSPVIDDYRAYFSDSYRDLKRAVAEILLAINRTHGDEVPATFERTMRVTGERAQFWSRFVDTPNVTMDTAAIAHDWRSAREAVAAAIGAKQAGPLERMDLPDEAQAALATYEAHRNAVATLSRQLQEANVAIQLVKERAATGNLTTLATDIARLKAVKARHTTTTAALCEDYLAEKAEKANTEQLRDQARTELDRYSVSAFPGCQAAINIYLERFNAGFRLNDVTAANTRGGPACTYNVVINDTPVPVAGGEPAQGEPSFRNTLSAGDRNTLALAFFFASLDRDPGLANKIVVIDDPISSLDEHRSLTTVQEVRRIAPRVSQLIVLSHSKSFLCRLWEGTDRNLRAALQVSRLGGGSTIAGWDINEDSVTEHDRRHALLREYLATGRPNSRDVARCIRPMLEAFFRIACPEYFPAGQLLGRFRDQCEQAIGTHQEILNLQDTEELRDLIEYSNRFHHDTNHTWQTVVINEGELRGFVGRALRFAKR